MNIQFDSSRIAQEIHLELSPLSQGAVQGLAFLIAHCEKDDWDSIPQVAYVLATVRHETANTFQPIEERGNRAYFLKYEPGTRLGRNLGNTLTGDGFTFRGRGYCQLTGRRLYRLFAGLMPGSELDRYPDRAREPELAYQILSTGLRKGLFTGIPLGRFVSQARVNYYAARQCVNGLDRAKEISQAATIIEKALRSAVITPVAKAAAQVPTATSKSNMGTAAQSSREASGRAISVAAASGFVGLLGRKAVRYVIANPKTTGAAAAGLAASLGAYLGWNVSLRTQVLINSLTITAIGLLAEDGSPKENQK
jgi:putative chitinase